MSISSWYYNWKSRPTRRSARDNRRVAFHPRLDPLEDRTLLSFGFGGAFSFGGPDMDAGFSIAHDAAGNVYTSGYYAGSAAVDFDPGPGTFYLNSGGNYDAFAAKYLPDGTFQWAKDLGRTNECSRIAVQNSAVYVAYAGVAGDTNVAKLDAASGNLVWPAPVQLASSGSSNSVSVAVSPSSTNVYVTGSNSSSQAFVAKLDALGNSLWNAPTAGGSAQGRGVAVDGSDNVYATGVYTGTVNFGPGRTLTSLSGSQDIFAWKLNATGVPVWAGSFGGIGNDDAGFTMGGIAVDSGGNVVVTGSLGYAQNISRNNDFDPGPGVFRLTSNGGDDIFVVKLPSFHAA